MTPVAVHAKKQGHIIQIRPINLVSASIHFVHLVNYSNCFCFPGRSVSVMLILLTSLHLGHRKVQSSIHHVSSLGSLLITAKRSTCSAHYWSLLELLKKSTFLNLELLAANFLKVNCSDRHNYVFYC